MCKATTTTAGVTSYAISSIDFKSKLANKSAVKACTNLAKAMSLADGAECAKSVLIAELASYIRSGAITEYNNISELCAELFDIGKAQTYNYIKAAQFMVCSEVLDENGKSTGKTVYHDKWSKGFSTTALIAFAYFIKSSPNSLDEDTVARARRNFVEQSIVDGKITASMSVSAIKKYLNGFENPVEAAISSNKPAEGAEGAGKPAEGAEGAGKPTEGAGKPAGKPAEGAEVNGIELTLDENAIKALSAVFKSIDVNAYPALTEIVGKVNHYMTTAKKAKARSTRKGKGKGKAQNKPAEGAEGAGKPAEGAGKPAEGAEG